MVITSNVPITKRLSEITGNMLGSMNIFLLYLSCASFLSIVLINQSINQVNKGYSLHLTWIN